VHTTAFSRLIAFVLIAAIAPPAASQNWIIEPVTAAGEVHAPTSLAVGPDHVPHVIAAGKHYPYAAIYLSRVDGVWSGENAVENGYFDSNRALRFDAEGRPHIGAVNWLAIRSETGWTTSFPAIGGDPWWMAMAIGTGGESRFCAVWAIGAGSYTGGFSYGYEQLSPNLFIPRTPGCEMEFTSSGRPNIVVVLNEGQPVTLWHNPKGTWKHEEIEPGLYPSIAIDTHSRVHVCYYSLPAHDLVYAVRTGPGTWLRETVDSEGEVGQSPSLSVDADGRVRISYYDASHGDLKFAMSQGIGTPWVVKTVDGLSSDVGQRSSLAVDGGVVHISYYDAGTSTLRYAQLTGSLTGVDDSPALRVPSVRAVPNPFNPSTTLEYTVPARGRVRVTVFDATGRVVETLVDADRVPGAYQVQYRARTASGVYFARVEIAGQTASTKIVVLK
jgi:hypothetical protein